MNPEISIIIPCYNVEAFLEETINSYLSQSFDNFELILIDDASLDNTREIIKKFAERDERIKSVFLSKNIGKAGAVNEGFKFVRGGYISIFDSDDIVMPNKLAMQYDFLEENSEIDFVYGDFIVFDAKGDKKIIEAVDFRDLEEPLLRLKTFFAHLRKVKYTFQILDEKKFIPASSNLFRRKIIDEGLKMDVNLRNSEDYDFWFQIIGAGYKIKRMPFITYKYREHENQKSKNLKKMDIARDYILNKLKKGEYFK